MKNIWEEIYAAGRHLNRYPWDSVVSFLYRQAKPLNESRILEIGCGTGSNLWFAAREGADVYGVDCSPTALEYARQRFQNESLKGNFYLATLPNLPDFDEPFDVIIDRSCLTHCELPAIRETLLNLSRIGRTLFSTIHANDHSSNSPKTQGTLAGLGHVTYLNQEEAEEIYGEAWKIETLSRHTKESDDSLHSEWHLTANSLGSGHV